MAAVLTGTPVAVTWASGANPAGQSITIPSDATAVYMFWAYYTSADGNGLSTVTLNGANPSQTFEIPTAATDQTGTGVAAWYNPTTGSQTLDPAWDAAPEEGSTCIVAFVKDGDTTAWRDADADNQDASAAASVTLTTVSGDLVIKFDQRFGTAPALSSGWTNGQTTTNNGEGARLSYISATGTTQVCASEDDNYSSVCAISIPAAAAGSTGTLAYTEQNDTSDASGTTTVTGTSTPTEQSDTSSASGTTTIVGTSAVTEQDDTLAASGTAGEAASGTVNYTEQNDTLSASGTTTVRGTASNTEANDTVVGTGTTTIIGTSSTTEGNDTLSASGSSGTPPATTSRLPLVGVGT
jgi:hypothetical protein